MRAQTDWDRCEPSYLDADLERVVDTVGHNRLAARLAEVLGTSMAGRPEAAMRAWRVLVARMDGKTLDQIGAAEGRSRERIRQILSEVRKIAAAQPNLFDGFDALDHASRCEALNCRFDSRFWRLGYTNESPKTASPQKTARTPARKALA